MKNKIIWILIALSILGILSGCSTETSGTAKQKVVIYSSAEDYRNEYFITKLKEKFPNYEIMLEYLPTGNHAAKLKSESTNTDCDITFDLEYCYLEQMKENFADLSKYDFSIYIDDLIDQDKKYLPEVRLSGAVILNNTVMREKNLPLPTSYEDLLKPEYKGLISMPSPKSSGTGYIFLKSLVNAWGEERTFAYFDELSVNILQFTSSGSGPIQALLTKEAAIGLGITAQAVKEINHGADFSIHFFKEGAPYTAYGTAIIKGKEKNPAVREVFQYINDVLIVDNTRLFFPEKMYKDKDFTIDNFPNPIQYADMHGNTMAEKERLLAKWSH